MIPGGEETRRFIPLTALQHLRKLTLRQHVASKISQGLLRLGSKPTCQKRMPMSQFPSLPSCLLKLLLVRRREICKFPRSEIQIGDIHFLRHAPMDLKTLTNKIWPDPTDLHVTLGQLLRRADADIAQLQAERIWRESERQQRRLKYCRSTLQCAPLKTITKWLQHKEMSQIQVSVKHGDKLADNNAQAANYFHQHWQQLWNQQPS